MSQPTPALAAVLAATEVVPADWHDLATILQRFGGPRALLGRSTVNGDRDTDLLQYLQRSIDPVRISHWLKQLEELAASMPDVDFVTVESPEYPANLKKAYGRPPFLFIRGSVNDSDTLSLAIVGNRKASQEGLAAANSVSEVAAKHGITVVSGLARGIDASGHLRAIHAGGRTIAVIAAGIDQPISRESDPALSAIMPKYGSSLAISSWITAHQQLFSTAEWCNFGPFAR